MLCQRGSVIGWPTLIMSATNSNVCQQSKKLDAAGSSHQIGQLQTMSAKQKTRCSWLQPPDWSAKCKILTCWLCLRLVSSKRKFSQHFNCLPLPLPLPLPASATATATATATTTTLTATLLLCFCCF